MRLLYPLAKRFIAGHDLDSAEPKIKELINSGFEVSVDYIGENSLSFKAARHAYRQYLRILERFKDYPIDISVKPSQLGLHIHLYLAYVLINGLAKRAKKHKQTIRLDMEDSSVTEATRNIAISLNEKYGNVGVAIQANLKRTNKDLTILINKNVSVRLVKGAYREEPNKAYQDYFSISSCFFDYAARMYSKRSNKPAIATHDEELLEDIQELIPDPEYFDYEFLYGIRRDLQKEYKNQGKKVRIYIPFGTHWLPYTLRRLKEWKNLKFVFLNMVKEWFK